MKTRLTESYRINIAIELPKRYSAAALMILVMFFGCKSSSPNAPQGSTGDLKGTVGLIDVHGNEVADKSGVTVQVVGTSYSAVSDTAGNWDIRNLPTQTYTIAFSKSGYGTVRNTSFSYMSGGTVDYGSRVYLCQGLSVGIAIDSLNAIYDSLPGLYVPNGYVSGHLTGETFADSGAYAVLVFFSKKPGIRFEDTSTYFGGLVFRNSGTLGRLTKSGAHLAFTSPNWEACGSGQWCVHGETIYMKAFAYLDNDYYLTRYYDVSSGMWIFTNTIPESALDSVKIP